MSTVSILYYYPNIAPIAEFQDRRIRRSICEVGIVSGKNDYTITRKKKTRTITWALVPDVEVVWVFNVQSTSSSIVFGL